MRSWLFSDSSSLSSGVIFEMSSVYLVLYDSSVPEYFFAQSSVHEPQFCWKTAINATESFFVLSIS